MENKKLLLKVIAKSILAVLFAVSLVRIILILL